MYFTFLVYLISVLQKKTYIEGIVTQASDSNYWEHWDRQKLSSELELKRQHILKMNQVVYRLFLKIHLISPISDVIYLCVSSLFQNITNQLIELERHFNGLELNKFGGNDESQVSERALQRKFGSTRYFQFYSGS